MKKPLSSNPILVDTSVWVNFFNGNLTKATAYLRGAIPNTLLATCPVIVQEILQGTKNDKDFKNVKAFFEDMVQLNGDQYEMAVDAAALYRQLRNIGITIRKPNDCLIAIYAINNRLPFLHEDKDFDFISSNSSLKAIQL